MTYPTVVFLPVLRCDGPTGPTLMLSRQGHDSEESARKVDLAQHPNMLGLHAVIRVSYPIAQDCAPLITERPVLGTPAAARSLGIDTTRRADLPRPPTLAESQHGICFLCNQPMLPADETGRAADELGAPNLHHVIPASKGGKGLPANKVLTHVKCNGQYGNREPTLLHLDKLLEIYGRHAALATVHLWLARYPQPSAGKRKLHAVLTDWIKRNG